MALFRWRGNGAGTKTDWQDGRNWADGAGSAYAQARYPGSVASTYDDVVFDQALASGASSPTTNVNQTSAAAKLNSLRVGSEYDGAIGSTASDPSGKLKAEIDSVIIDGSGSAQTFYLYGSGAADGLKNLKVYGGTLVLDGRVTAPEFYKCTMTISSTAVIVTSCLFAYMTSIDSDVLATISAGATMPSVVVARGGTVVNNNAITTLESYDGAWTQSAGNITTWNINGADCLWNDGNIATLNIYSGSLDGSESPISRRVGNVLLHNAGSFNIDNGLNNIYITGSIVTYDGTLTFCTGSQILQSTTDTYAGASDAVQGIPPISKAGGTTTTGNAILLNPYDRVIYYVTVGATDCTSITADIMEDVDTTHAAEAAIAAKQLTWNGTDDNKTKKIECWGYELTSGKFSVRPSIAVTGGSASLISCNIILKRAL